MVPEDPLREETYDFITNAEDQHGQVAIVVKLVYADIHGEPELLVQWREDMDADYIADVLNRAAIKLRETPTEKEVHQAGYLPPALGNPE